MFEKKSPATDLIWGKKKMKADHNILLWNKDLFISTDMSERDCFLELLFFNLRMRNKNWKRKQNTTERNSSGSTTCTFDWNQFSR